MVGAKHVTIRLPMYVKPCMYEQQRTHSDFVRYLAELAEVRAGVVVPCRLGRCCRCCRCLLHLADL